MSIQPHSNGHDTHHTPGVAEAPCPYCGQSISRKEYREIQARIEMEERARLAKIETELKARVAREVAKAEAGKKAEVAKIKKDTEHQFKVAKAALEATVNARLLAQQEVSDKKLTEAVASERTKAYADRMKLDAQLQDLQRQLERRTAGELGDEGELNTFEALVAGFPGDQIERVAKGVAGADIVHRVIQNGIVCGAILYDVKNHKRWQNKWTPKLREDQIAAGADHAVLVTTVFPADFQQLMVKDNVVVTAPARLIAVAHMLRAHIVRTYSLKLNTEARDEKTERLYEFITSDRASDRWDRMSQATNDLLGIERSDAAWQEKTRSRRTGLIHAVRGVHDEFTSEIDRIIGGAS